MFGGVGLYADGCMFALIDDDMVYLKADDLSRERFLAAGSVPFAPYGDGGPIMSYYAIPAEVLADPDALRPWVELAVAAAQRARSGKKSSRRRASGQKDRDS